MDADGRRSMASLPINDLTEKVIGCAMAVSNALGAGFLEKVYENALGLELRAATIGVTQQYPIDVRYRGESVGIYVADLFVDKRLIVEVKAVKSLDPVHVAQCINYLKATGQSVGLLLNFGQPRLQIKRLVHQHKQQD